MKKAVNIILVDDHKLFRNGMKTLLESIGNYKIIAEASNGEDFLKLLDTINPDIVLLDISMPVMDGLTAAPLALKKKPDLKIIALSMYGDEEYYNKMSSIGVKGFLLKDSEIDEVQLALDTVYHDGCFFSQKLLISILSTIKKGSQNEYPTVELSEREQEVLELTCRGMSNNEIGDKLFISKRTVEKHRANLLEKTQCNNTASLVMWAIRHKMVNP